MRRLTNVAALRTGASTLIESEMINCKRCGNPITSERVLSRLASMLGNDGSTDWMRELCIDSRAVGS